MTRHRRAIVAVGVFFAAVCTLAGCKPKQIAVVCAPPLAKEELIAQNNANAAKVPSLRASADVEILVRYEGQEHSVPRLRDGLLLLLKNPQDPQAVPSFLLRGVIISEPYLGAGVDAAAGDYYGWIDAPSVPRGARWGQLSNLHRPGYESLPVDPVDVLSVLTVLPWPVDEPGRPVISVPKDNPCIYDLLFLGSAEGGRVQLRRQVWMDRSVQPARPTRVWILDPEGRVTVDATLEDYGRIDVPNLPANQRPEMPTVITLRYPQEKEIMGVTILSLKLRLTNLTVGTDSTPVRPAMFRRQSVIPSRIEDQKELGPIREAPEAPAAGKPAPVLEAAP